MKKPKINKTPNIEKQTTEKKRSSKKNLPKGTSNKKVIIKPIVSTNVSLIALTFSSFIIDLMSSTIDQHFVTRIFQRNEKDEPLFVAENLYDLEGVLEQTFIYNDNKPYVVTSAETIEKLRKLNEQKRGLKFYLDFQNLADEVNFDFENLKNAYEQPFQNSFERASELLYWIIFLEPLFKFETHQKIINFCYTLVRSIKYLPSMKTLRRDFANKVGLGWEWELTWALARQSDKVKKFWDGEEKNGELRFKDWKKECQKLATNSWNLKDHRIKDIKKHAATLRKRLKNKFNFL